MLKLKKMLKRLLPFLVSCLTLTSCFVFTSSAINVDDSYHNGFQMEHAYIYLYNGVGSDIISSLEVSTVNDKTFRYYIKTSEPLVKGNDYELSVALSCSDFYYTKDYSVLGSYNILLQKNGNFSINKSLSIGSFRRGDGIIQSASTSSSITSEGFPLFRTSYDSQPLNTQFRQYFSRFVFSVDNSTTSEIYIYLSDVNFRLVDPTAAAITENQDKNTDKILNGGHDSPQYNGADEQAVNDYKQAEKSVMDKISGGLDDAADLFSGFTGIISPGAFTGLSVVSTYMERLIDIPHIGLLVRVALILGLFSFVIGSAMILVRFGGSNNRRYDSGRSRSGTSKVKKGG